MLYMKAESSAFACIAGAALGKANLTIVILGEAHPRQTLAPGLPFQGASAGARKAPCKARAWARVFSAICKPWEIAIKIVFGRFCGNR